MAGQRGDTTERLALALAILTGTAALVLARAPSALMPSRSCAGLSDLTTLSLARLTPSLPVSVWISWVNSLVLFAGVAWTTRLAQRLSGNILVGTSIGGAIAAWAAGSPQFAMLQGAGPLVTAAVLWSILGGARRASRLTLWAALAVSVALWPSAVAACVMVFTFAGAPPVTGSIDRSRLPGAAAIAAAGALVQFAARGATSLPGMASCLAPSLGTEFVVNTSAILAGVGPYVVVLAALGLFGHRREIRPWLWLAIAFALLCSPQAASSAAPVAIGLAAACGLREATQACRPGVGGRLAAALLVALVPALAWQSALAAPAPSPDARTFGHDRLSLTLMRRLLSTLPPDARVLPEDATTDAIVRAAGQPPATMAPVRDTSRIAADLSNGSRLFALPLAQREMGQLGFRLADLLPGMAEVQAGATCRLATSEWRSLGDFEGAPALTLAARTPAEAGPVVVYAGFDARPELVAAEWPSAARRGFYTTVYDLGSAEDRAHVLQDVSDDGAPAERVSTRAFVARLELWRTPTAPLRLTVTLGAQPHEVFARVIAKAEPRRLWLCPTYPHDVARLGD